MLNRFAQPTRGLSLLIVSGLLLGCCLSLVGCARTSNDPIANLKTADEIRRQLLVNKNAEEKQPETKTPTGIATLRGQFLFQGTPPERRLLNADKNLDVCAPGGQKPQDNTLLIGENGGIANVLVFAMNVKSKLDPTAKPTNPDPVFDQIKCMFISPVFVAQVGQTIKVKNSDATGHNTNITGYENLLVPELQTVNFVVPSQTVTPVEVTCNIHPWMKAYMLFRKDGYFAVTDQDGKFEIPNLPAGGEPIEFQVWHPTAKGGLSVKSSDFTTDAKGRIKIKLAPDETKDFKEIKVERTALVGG